MRVVHVVSSLRIGGAERFCVDLAHAQVRSGLDAVIVELGDAKQELAEQARRHGVRVFGVGRFRSRLVRMAALGGMLAARDHVLHVHNPWALRAVLPILPTQRGAVVYTRHGAFPYAKLQWRLVHKLARRFIDRVTFVTQEARGSFEAVHGPPAEDHRHLVVENGVVVAPAGTRRARRGRIRIGTVGRLVELKGQRYILDAVRGLTGVEVHLFGDGPEREPLAELARGVGVPVVFHGTVIDREQIYSSIDILVVASRTEGQSMAIMEAMARGIPAIATAVGGNPELVRDGETGLLVPPGNPLAIRGALARLVADPELRARLGRASHARIAMHHSIDAVAEKYRAIYASA